MRRALFFTTTALVAFSCSATLFSDLGAALFFTLFATATICVLVEGEFNIARFGTPWIIRRKETPLAYWIGVTILSVFVATVLVLGPKNDPSLLRRAYARFIQAA